VARLAGLPREVLARAREVLTNLERNEFGRDGLPSLARGARGTGGGPAAPGGTDQLPLFVPASEAPRDPVLDEIKDLDPTASRRFRPSA
jgi:DNA mismatch repair protein MutS